MPTAIQVSKASNLKTIPASQDFKFGQHFSDHWFFAKFHQEKGWFEARVEPYGKIAMDPAASVLHYGQALFEGMKAFRQKNGEVALFRPEFNYVRMKEGAERLCLEAPPRDIFMNGLRELIQVDKRWVPVEDGCSLYIRPTLIGTEPFLGVRPSREVMFFILLSPVGSYYSGASETVRIWVEEKTLRAAPGGLGATKAGANYAASLQAGLMARNKGYAQVLWLDVERQGIEEVGTMNVFFVFKDEIVTPALNGSILAGGLRDSTLQLLKYEGAKIRERRVTIAEVVDRHKCGELLEAFGTGTAAVISPIGELNYREHPLIINNSKTGPVAERLKRIISGIQRGTEPDRLGWMTPLEKL